MLTLHMLKPSANSLPVRAFVRAAGLEFSEIDAWGHTRTPEFLAKCPAHMTPMLEDASLPGGAMWESGAIMQYLCNRHGLDKFYPTDPARRAMVDSALLYHAGTLYPLVSRATYPALGFPAYPGEVGASDAGDAEKKRAQQAAIDAIAEPLDVFRSFFLGKNKFIGGDHPSIADIRVSSTLEFLASIDYPLPAWTKTWIAAIEAALGKAYAEPVADVRGYIQHVKSKSA